LNKAFYDKRRLDEDSKKEKSNLFNCVIKPVSNMNKQDIKIPQPTQCRFWDEPEAFRTERGLLKEEKSYVEDSHIIRRLLKCEECGQLYFYEFYETID